MQIPDTQRLIDQMSLEEKIGQMFMGNICGGENLDIARRQFEEFHFGALQFSGVFERFIRGGDYLPCGVDRNKPLDEVAEFLYNIKQAAKEIVGIPAIMAGDQEGSVSNSIFRRRNVALMPNQMGFGASGSLQHAYESARISAREMKLLGLDMLYGPSLDVLTSAANPEIGARSFSEDPEIAAAMGEQFVKAYAVENIISNVKHFPGRGNGIVNAHHELESIEVSRERMHAVELLPFKRAIAAGVDSFMIAHTLFPAFEQRRLPASLSPLLIQGLLRDELGFDGVVIPDDLSMFAISNNFGVPEASAMCLEAGADMVFTKVREMYRPTVEAIKRSVADGRLTEERINQSLHRIFKMKIKHRLYDDEAFSRAKVLSTVGCPAHAMVATQAAENSVVLLKNAGCLLPLHPTAVHSALAIVPRDMNVVMSNDDVLNHALLANALAKELPDVQHIVIDESPTVLQGYEAVGRAKNADVILFGIYSAGASEGQLQLLQEICDLGKPVIVVITNSPYAAVQLPQNVSAVICCFGISTFAFQAAVNVMMGKLTPIATLPVTLSPELPRGFSVCLETGAPV
ncbi:MAG: glycoside hydrolase family 3 protein [Armatimonadota bacterium]